MNNQSNWGTYYCHIILAASISIVLLELWAEQVNQKWKMKVEFLVEEPVVEVTICCWCHDGTWWKIVVKGGNWRWFLVVFYCWRRIKYDGCVRQIWWWCFTASMKMARCVVVEGEGGGWKWSKWLFKLLEWVDWRRVLRLVWRRRGYVEKVIIGDEEESL